MNLFALLRSLFPWLFPAAPVVSPPPPPPPPPPAPAPQPLVSPFAWDQQLTPGTAALEAIVATVIGPWAVQSWAWAHLAWKNDYDTMRFLAPDETLARGSGNCSALARMYQYILGRQGIQADLVVLEDGASDAAHAVCVFVSPDAGLKGGYVFSSNRDYLGSSAIAVTRKEAWIAVCEHFYGDSWSCFYVYSSDGVLIAQQSRGGGLRTQSVKTRNWEAIK